MSGKRVVLKQIVLTGLVFVVGVGVGARGSRRNMSEVGEVFYIGNKSYNTEETLDGLLNFDNSGMTNLIRNYGLYTALNEEYGSEYVEQKVDQLESDMYKAEGIDPNDPTAVYKLGYNSKEEMRNHLRLNTLIERYIEEKVPDSVVEERYSSWEPSMTVVIVPAGDDTDGLIEEWENVEDKDDQVLYRFLKDNGVTNYEAIDIPNHQKMFSEDDYQKLIELERYGATTITAPDGNSEILAFSIIKTEKTDFETDKEAVKADIIDEMRTNDVKFTNDLMEDLGVKGSDKVDLVYR